jgi:hypothetical protein
MNVRATEFLDRWEADHVEAVLPGRRDAVAAELAQRCREDAARAGIAMSDLVQAANGNLVRCMREALEAAN